MDFLPTVHIGESGVEFVPSADGVKLAVRVAGGKGGRTPLIMLHGLQSHSGWFVQSQTFLSGLGFPVYAMDRRGSGLSEGPCGDCTRIRRAIRPRRFTPNCIASPTKRAPASPCGVRNFRPRWWRWWTAWSRATPPNASPRPATLRPPSRPSRRPATCRPCSPACHSRNFRNTFELLPGHPADGSSTVSPRHLPAFAGSARRRGHAGFPERQEIPDTPRECGEPFGERRL